MDSVQPSNNFESRNGEEITEMEQDDPREQTQKFQSHEHKESVDSEGDPGDQNTEPLQKIQKCETLDDNMEMLSGNTMTERPYVDNLPSRSWISRNEDEIFTDMEPMVGIEHDPSDQTGELLRKFRDCETLEDTLKLLVNQSNQTRRDIVDHSHYATLYRAIVEKNWKGVKDFLEQYPGASYDKLTETSQTFFQVILGLIDHDEAILLVEEFLPFVPKRSLLQGDASGSTVLNTAAGVGSTMAIKLLVSREPNLPNIKNDLNYFPIHHAAFFGHKETVLYLLSVTSNEVPSPFVGESGVLLLELLIKSNLYGIALGLLKRYPNLGRETKYDRKRVLQILARKPLGFASGNRIGYWQRLIYHRIPVKDEDIPSFKTNGNDSPHSKNVDVDEDMENPMERPKIHPTTSTHFGFLRYIGQIATKLGALRNQELHTMLWNALIRLAPSIKSIHDTKLSNMQTVEIVRMMCANENIWRYEEASEIFKNPVLRAARLGISEFVDEIIKAYRNSFFFVNEEGNNIFQLAVLHRRGKVFNLMYKIGPLKAWAGFTDKSGNNILHLTGQSVPSSQLAGAALQMQRELQWFQAVENFVHPSVREEENSSNKTPREVFTQEHEKLVEKGEKWMKDTAQSCSVVAALIITVVFAAAFTVPGGSDPNGVPNFLHEPSFLIFIISDGLALFTSTISVLMFLGILTSRYSQEDFLESLPKKLIIGFIALFLSIASMMIAFGAVIYMTISGLWSLVFIPIVILACVTVTIFARLQFPLLLDMILSTYGPSIFQLKK